MIKASGQELFEFEEEVEELDFVQEHKRIPVTLNLESNDLDSIMDHILKRMWNCRGKHTLTIDKVKMEVIIREEFSKYTRESEVYGTDD